MYLTRYKIAAVLALVGVVAGLGLVLTSPSYGQSPDCYDGFIYAWHMLDDVLECFDSSIGGGNVTGCADLDCLEDVLIIDVDNNQILQYNETLGLWENRSVMHNVTLSYNTDDSTYSVNGLGNSFNVVQVDDAAGIYFLVGGDGGDSPIELNLLGSGHDTVLYNLAETFEIDYSVSDSFVLILNGNDGSVLFPTTINHDDDVFSFPSIGGTFLTTGAVIDDLSDVVITSPVNNQVLTYSSGNWVNLAPVVYENNTASCLNPTGECVFAQKVGSDLQFKKLLAGTGISLSANATRITITNTLPESTVCTNVGSGSGLCSGGNVNVDSLIAGTGISITDTIDDYTLASQCANTGGGEPICESGNNINSLIAGTGITITDTTGDLTIASSVVDTDTDKQIGQMMTEIHSSATKTNIGTSYVDIYSTGLGIQEGARRGTDFSNVTYVKLVWQYDVVGSGTHTVRLVDVGNNANVLVETAGFTIDCNPACATAWTVKPAFASGVVDLEIQAKSTTAGDDPVFHSYVLWVK